MSYAVRNTLILLVVLLVLVGAGGSYIYFVQQPKVEKIRAQVEEKRQELTKKQEIASRYLVLKKRYEKATEYLENFEKGLYGNSDEDNVFDFLNRLNRGSARTDFTFAFSDSTVNDKYGVLNMTVDGKAGYPQFVNFVRQIELSRPMNRISEISVNPIVEEDTFYKIAFSFKLQSFYDRVSLLGPPALTIKNNLLGGIPNPFYPLIHSIIPNKDNRLDVDSSSLLAVSGDKIFMLDQDGLLQTLKQGDQVYLGTLATLNVNQGTATFELNKGGIVEQLTLRVNNDDGNKNK